MKNLFLFLISAVLLISCRIPDKQLNLPPAQNDDRPVRGAVIAGDHPDPSVMKVGDIYWAAATTSAWVPAFTLMKSTDLANWEITGAIFPKAPSWTNGNYWAPELANLGDGFYVYYAAKNKLHGRMCVGVAKAKKPEGPYRDSGHPLICQGPGSIDAAPVVDEKGQKWLFWKEDGNSVKKPTPIMLSRLSKDGTKLVGKMVETIREDAPWEGVLVEGPSVFKHGDYWYMFYAGSACCTATCDYKVGVARAKSLTGPWEKYSKNPILKGNDFWQCPGHGTVSQKDGKNFFMYHAMDTRDTIYVGRQPLIDEVDWTTDAWPVINDNLGATTHASIFGARLKNKEITFEDQFEGRSLKPEWQWPYDLIPNFKVESGKLMLMAGSDAADPASAVIARPLTTPKYLAEALVNLSQMKENASAGLSLYGSPRRNLGISVDKEKTHVWIRDKDSFKELQTFPTMKSSQVKISIEIEKGYLARFTVEGENHERVQTAWENGSTLPPWDLGLRIALTAGGPKGSAAIFESFKASP
jgi:xylan 1,4-beta-xylosidase